ncbi:hypothetical protein Holit_02166 [Hollandina sp. SP2]
MRAFPERCVHAHLCIDRGNLCAGNFGYSCSFSVSGYVRAVARGAFDLSGYLHHSIVFPCVPVVFTPPSYFVDHHQIYIYIKLGRWF